VFRLVIIVCVFVIASGGAVVCLVNGFVRLCFSMMMMVMVVGGRLLSFFLSYCCYFVY